MFKQVNDNYHYLDLTHSKVVPNKKGNGVYYYKKITNPNPADNEPSYISPFPYKAHKDSFKNKVAWKFDSKDIDKINSYKNKRLH